MTASAPTMLPRPVSYLAIILLLYMTAFSLPTLYDSETPVNNAVASYEFVAKIVQAVSGALCVLVLVHRPQRMGRAVARGWIWLLLTLWAFATTLWSIEPKTTFLAAALMAIIIILTAYVAIRFPEGELSRLVAVYMAGLCGLSIAMGVFTPDYGLMNSPKFAGLLRGVYNSKNLLGDTVSLLLLWALCAIFAGVLRGVLAWVAVALASVAIFWTWSTTSILMVLFCLVPLFALRTAATLRVGAVALTTVLVIFTALLMVALPPIIQAVVSYFGKDLTFSGRDVIWQAYIDLAGERPLTGFGYSALKNSQDYGISIRFSNGSRPSPHNSFISMYADMGLPALFLYAVATIALMLKGVRQIGRGDRVGLFAAVFPIGYSINGFMEGVGGYSLSFGLVALVYLTMRPSTLPLVRPDGQASLLGRGPGARRSMSLSAQ